VKRRGFSLDATYRPRVKKPASRFLEHSASLNSLGKIKHKRACRFPLFPFNFYAHTIFILINPATIAFSNGVFLFFMRFAAHYHLFTGSLLVTG